MAGRGPYYGDDTQRSPVAAARLVNPDINGAESPPAAVPASSGGNDQGVSAGLIALIAGLNGRIVSYTPNPPSPHTTSKPAHYHTS